MRALQVAALGLVLLTVSGCATRAPFVHTRAGVTGDQLFAESQACQAISRATDVASVSPGYNHSSATAQAGASFGAGIAEGIAKGRAQVAAYEGCMAERGYLQTTLNEAELAEYNRLKSVEAKKAWMASFAARDHGARAQARPEPQACKPNMLVKCAQ